MSHIHYSNLNKINNKNNNCYNISYGFICGSCICIIIMILTILLITIQKAEDGSYIE